MSGCNLRLAVSTAMLAATVAAHSAPTLKALHDKTITPASDALFGAESTAPATTEQWQQLAQRARALAKASTQLKANLPHHSAKLWIKLAAALCAEATNAAHAANRRDLGALSEANGKVVAACEACHDVFRDGGHGMTSDLATQALPSPETPSSARYR